MDLEEAIMKAQLIAGLDENIKQGMVEVVGYDEKCEPIYKMTEKGKAKVEEMLKENPRLFIEMGLDDGLH